MFNRKGSVRRFLSAECTKPQLALFQHLKDEQAKYAKSKSLQAIAIEWTSWGSMKGLLGIDLLVALGGWVPASSILYYIATGLSGMDELSISTIRPTI